MRVLVACEESQRVCQAFRDKGHEAYSCDILPTSGQHPEWHIRDDIKNVYWNHHFLSQNGDLMWTPGWDMIIAFVPCDHLAVSGARWFPDKRMDGRQREAIEFFLKIWESDIPRITIENPIGIMSGSRDYIRRHYPDLYSRVMELPEPQIIQPWQFGHGETKATCLWLKNLPNLKPTNIVEGREARVHRMAPGPNRSRDRARTYPGIAKAMAEQWGSLA